MTPSEINAWLLFYPFWQPQCICLDCVLALFRLFCYGSRPNALVNVQMQHACSYILHFLTHWAVNLLMIRTANISHKTCKFNAGMTCYLQATYWNVVHISFTQWCCLDMSNPSLSLSLSLLYACVYVHVPTYTTHTTHTTHTHSSTCSSEGHRPGVITRGIIGCCWSSCNWTTAKTTPTHCVSVLSLSGMHVWVDGWPDVMHLMSASS